MKRQPAAYREAVVALVPQLRAFARFLARDVARADDLVQDTVLRALERQDAWTEGTDLRAWACRILRNLFLDQERRRRVERRGLSALPAHEAASHPPAQTGQDALRDLDAAIATLPAPQREALILVAALEMSLAEAAEITGAPEGTVKARVSRARAALARTYHARS
ncbi:sigma-70 family RNA polymerase sigma factor [Roseomonas sp. HJA6]|uniref:Sigma-70 family RNA polymerase sigma factor n=1 Tax=Roseomonas alba TaxID=2846776 RepID=A0ABS7A7M7_9PROT|nr:sigma-70 family RNA polymerase sigma factor [Neoroseomonas alba]MBW6398305.1 sigma-70 family RNA polymerase sigma factor [Neoroseomonas alba]